MKLDILCIAAHPDDVELAMSGTLILQKQKGLKTGIIDLTKGELGTNGDEDTRQAESKVASEIIGISMRANLDLGDGFFENNKSNQVKLIECIRAHQPELVFCNAPFDRHPDHGKAAEFVRTACFLSGLVKIETQHNGQKQGPWRPKAIYNYIQDYYHKPDFVIDITDVYEEREKAIMAYESQFYSSDKLNLKTPISTPEFLEFLKGRALEFGRRIGVKYGEGFVSESPLKLDDLI